MIGHTVFGFTTLFGDLKNEIAQTRHQNRIAGDQEYNQILDPSNPAVL